VLKSRTYGVLRFKAAQARGEEFSTTDIFASVGGGWGPTITPSDNAYPISVTAYMICDVANYFA
jgi:hypothetical protein